MSWLDSHCGERRAISARHAPDRPGRESHERLARREPFQAFSGIVVGRRKTHVMKPVQIRLEEGAPLVQHGMMGIARGDHHHGARHRDEGEEVEEDRL
jgi:hypothetical protein